MPACAYPPGSSWGSSLGASGGSCITPHRKKRNRQHCTQKNTRFLELRDSYFFWIAWMCSLKWRLVVVQKRRKLIKPPMIQVGLDDLSKNSRKRYQVFKVSVPDDRINEWNTIHIHSRRRFSVIDQNNWRETETNGGFAKGICLAKKQQRHSLKKSGLVSVAQNRGHCITNPNNALFFRWNPS